MNPYNGHRSRHGAGNAGRFSPEIMKEIIDFLGIGEEDSILDLGGGDGFFSKGFLSVSKNVTLLDKVDSNFKELETMGINTIIGDMCKFHDREFDTVFMANVYHDAAYECHDSIRNNLRLIAKKNVAILDFKPDASGFGPPSWLRLSKQQVISDLVSSGFKLVREKDLEYHYLLIFEKSELR